MKTKKAARQTDRALLNKLAASLPNADMIGVRAGREDRPVRLRASPMACAP